MRYRTAMTVYYERHCESRNCDFVAPLNYSTTICTQCVKNKQMLQHGSRFAGLPAISYHSTRSFDKRYYHNLPAGMKNTFTQTDGTVVIVPLFCRDTLVTDDCFIPETPLPVLYLMTVLITFN